MIHEYHAVPHVLCSLLVLLVPEVLVDHVVYVVLGGDVEVVVVLAF